jgi:hypothetical protein
MNVSKLRNSLRFPCCASSHRDVLTELIRFLLEMRSDRYPVKLRGENYVFF